MNELIEKYKNKINDLFYSSKEYKQFQEIEDKAKKYENDKADLKSNLDSAEELEDYEKIVELQMSIDKTEKVLALMYHKQNAIDMSKAVKYSDIQRLTNELKTEFDAVANAYRKELLEALNHALELLAKAEDMNVQAGNFEQYLRKEYNYYNALNCTADNDATFRDVLLSKKRELDTFLALK